MNILIIDTETTGLPISFSNYTCLSSYDNARLLQLSFIVVNTNQQLIAVRNMCIKRDNVKYSEFHKITQHLSNNHGIEIINALKYLLLVIKRHKIQLIVGHNIEFDIDVIKSEVFRLNDNIVNPLIDLLSSISTFCTCKTTTQITQLQLPNRTFYKYPKLSELYEKCTGKILQGSHDSLNDTFATAVCFFHIHNNKEYYKKIKDMIDVSINTEKKFNPCLILNNNIDDGLPSHKGKIISIYCDNNDVIYVKAKILIKLCGNNVLKLGNKELFTIRTKFKKEHVKHFINFCLVNRMRFIFPKYGVNNTINDENYLFNVKDDTYINTINKKEELSALLDIGKFFKCQYLIDIINLHNIRILSKIPTIIVHS